MKRRSQFRSVLFLLLAVLGVSVRAGAEEASVPVHRVSATFLTTDAAPVEAASPLRGLVTLAPRPVRAADVLPGMPARDDDQGPPPRAFEYSDAYHTRARIHRVASFATLPLFGLEGYLGQSLYNSPTDGKKSAHLVVAGAIAGLFAVNSVTGVMNLLEARHDPNFGKRRWIHAVLMLAADAGFLATAMAAPEHEHRSSVLATTSSSNAATHRAIAFTSISMATTSYLIMLFGGH